MNFLPCMDENSRILIPGRSPSARSRWQCIGDSLHEY